MEGRNGRQESTGGREGGRQWRGKHARMLRVVSRDWRSKRVITVRCRLNDEERGGSIPRGVGRDWRSQRGVTVRGRHLPTLLHANLNLCVGLNFNLQLPSPTPAYLF